MLGSAADLSSEPLDMRSATAISGAWSNGGDRSGSRCQRRAERFKEPFRAVQLACWMILSAYPAAAQRMPDLVLRELVAIPVPGSLDVTSGRILNDSVVVFMSRSQRTVWKVSPTSWHAVCPLDLRNPVALAVRDELITVLDADHRLVSPLPESGGRCRSKPLSTDTSNAISDAVAVRTGWIVALRSSDAKTWIVRLDVDGRELRRSRMSGRKGDALSASHSLLSSAGDSAVFSSTVWPFNWTTVGQAGPEAAQHAPRLPTSSPLTRKVPAEEDWIGLRTVQLDSGFLQVLAERSGERRVLVLYDRRAQMQRFSEVAVILGVLESIPSTRRLLMARRTSEPELVIYEWGWGGANQLSPR